MTYSTLAKAVAMAAVANFFWAANAIVGKIALATVPAFTLSQFRWWLSFLIIAPFGLPALVKHRAWFRQQFWRMLALSILSVTFYNTLQYWALEYTEPVNVGAMLALMPLFIAVIVLLVDKQTLSVTKWLFMLVAVLGSLTVITDGQLVQLFSAQGFGIGELLMVVAVTSWAVYSVLLKNIQVSEVPLVAALTFMMLFGSLCILPFWLWDVATAPVFFPEGRLWGFVLFVAIFPSIVSYFAWNYAVTTSNATIAGLIVTSAPVFNALLSMFFLNERIGVFQWVGMLLIIVGVAAVLLAPAKKH